jgi:hypothetical protein
MEGGPYMPAIYEAVFTTNDAELARAVLDRAWWKDDTALREYITKQRSDTTPLTSRYVAENHPAAARVIASVLKDLDTKK